MNSCNCESGVSVNEYFKLCKELGEIINEQQNTILSLKSENKRLKRENWNLKANKKGRW